MKKIDLTFGIPVYNADRFINDLLDCFNRDVELNYEVIIVDDGSTDNTYSICKMFKNKKFKVFHKANGGVSSTRNFIINKAKGKWITFVDADDLIDIEKYAEFYQKKIAKDTEHDYFFGILNKEFYEISKKNLGFLIENELINFPWLRFYKLDLIKKGNIFFPEKLSIGEDLIFNLKYFMKSKNIEYFLNNDMYNFRIVNENSLTHKYRSDKFIELMKVNTICRNIVKDKKSLKALEYIRIKNCLSCVKDFYRFSDIYDNNIINRKIKLMKEYKKRQFLFLNTFKTTIIYNGWYILPNKLIKFIVKRNL